MGALNKIWDALGSFSEDPVLASIEKYAIIAVLKIFKAK